MSKGQVFTADFVASVTIFSIFVVFFGVAWNSSVEKFAPEAESSRQTIENRFSLMKTEGYPEDWDSENIEVPGLYEGDHLSLEKFSDLKSTKLSTKRSLLKAQEFRLGLEYLNGSDVTYKGSNMSFSSEEIPVNRSVYVKRSYVVLDENRKRAKLSYLVWKG